MIDGTKSMSPAGALSAQLRIDLAALISNYKLLKDKAAPAKTAAVVKADAYGLGMKEVALSLAGVGVDCFFVAQVSEGIKLRQILNTFKNRPADIFVFAGLQPGSETFFIKHNLIPVLNSLPEIDRWAGCGRQPAAIQLDTGMNRLGLDEHTIEELHVCPQRLKNLDLKLIMSHFACADDPQHPLNQTQLERFRALKEKLPSAPASISNSAGIFLGSAAHFDVVRPGIALYGGNPQTGAPNPMRPVISLSAPILQIREVEAGQTIGYGATYRTNTFSRIAVISLGYADGFLRCFGQKATLRLAGAMVPIVGRVSMDLIALDVTAIPGAQIQVGDRVNILDTSTTIDDLALAGGTISYEILTLLGLRYEREYVQVGG